jgi:hypothetical protein
MSAPIDGVSKVIGFIEQLQNVTIQVTVALSSIHTLYNLLQHARSLFSLLCLYQSLPGNGLQRRSVLSFRVYALTGWQLSQN